MNTEFSSHETCTHEPCASDDTRAFREAWMTRRERARKRLLSTPQPALELKKDIYADGAVFRLIHDVDVATAEEQLHFTADWFEHPHPNGRDHRGEADFASIRMVNALYRCYDKVSDGCRAALDNFFLRRDYSSIYGSENHALMYRVSRLLAAQFYAGRVFEQYGMTAEDVMREDAAYIDEFLMYRARRAWGEFDSCGYAAEIMLILNVLYMYTTDERLKKKAAMSMDMILLDMIVDSKNGVYGGAHGRIYEHNALNSFSSGMYTYYCYYFGADAGMPENIMGMTAAILSDYYPADIVCRVAKNRTFPYENRERKHLHLCEAWVNGIDREMLAKVEGLSIDKYLYLSDRYLLGSVTHQDSYPDSVPGGWYAHHQQHEWELKLLPDETGRAKIFSHHPGDPGYHHTHNRWTGDNNCCCGTHFCTRDTAVSLYNITRENEYPYINADIPLEFFEEAVKEPNYLFLRYRTLYVTVWFSNGYRFVTEGETAGYEVISYGRKHAFVCNVEPAEKYGSLGAFADAMKARPIVFDPDTMTVECFGIRMDCKERYVDGQRQVFPSKMLYDSPYLTSEYGSGILHVTDGAVSAVYDFNF